MNWVQSVRRQDGGHDGDGDGGLDGLCGNQVGKAQQDGGKAVHEHAGFIHLAVQAKPDHRKTDAQADHRNQQVGHRLHQAGHTHHIRAGQRVTQVWLNNQADDFGAKVGNGKQDGVVHQRGVAFGI